MLFTNVYFRKDRTKIGEAYSSKRGIKMTTYNYTDEQRQETIKLLMDIQLHMPWKKARCECEHINESIKGIYEILDMVKHQSNQPEK